MIASTPTFPVGLKPIMSAECEVIRGDDIHVGVNTQGHTHIRIENHGCNASIVLDHQAALQVAKALIEVAEGKHER